MSENVNQTLSPASASEQAVASQCPNCGKQNEGGGRFCLSCGTDLRMDSAQPAPQASATNVSPSPAPVVQKIPVNHVIVTDINMTFGSMVVFMVKWAIASIPAMIILFLILGIISVVLGSVLGVLGGILYNFY